MRHERPDLRGLVQRVAEPEFRRALQQAFQEPLLDVFVEKDTGTVGADLTLAVEVAHHRARYSLLDVGVVEHDEGRLSPELDRYLLQRARGIGHDLLAGPGLARHRYLVDAGVRGQHPPDVTMALDDVEQTVGQTGIVERARKLERGQRRKLRRLEHERIARREAGSRFPARDLDGIVPRADAGADPEGFATGIDEGARQVRVLAVDPGSDAREEVEAFGAGLDVGLGRFLDRASRIETFQPSDFHLALAQDLRGSPQCAATLRAGQPTPLLLCATRRGHGVVHVRLRRGRDGAQFLAVRRVDVGERRVTAAVGETTIYEHVVMLDAHGVALRC